MTHPVVAIVGSRPETREELSERDMAARRAVRQFMTKLAAKYPQALIVSGGARGVDIWAERDAAEFGLEVVSYRPYTFEAMAQYANDKGFLYGIKRIAKGERGKSLIALHTNAPTFKSFGPCAFARNGWIIADADQVVAFWDGASRGTKDSIERARKLGKPLHIVRL